MTRIKWAQDPPIAANYSVFIQSGLGLPDVGDDPASIAQTGTLPMNAETLQFEAGGSYGLNFSVSFAGNVLSPTLESVNTAPSGELYGIFDANISPYAGQTGQLEFTALEDTGLLLDDVSFTTTPEPSPWILTAIGGLFFGARKLFPRLR